MATCQIYELMDGQGEDCTNQTQIWATYPMGCPGVMWYGLCLEHFVVETKFEVEVNHGETWQHDTQLVAFVDPSTLPNYGFPQYGKVEFNNVVK